MSAKVAATAPLSADLIGKRLARAASRTESWMQAKGRDRESVVKRIREEQEAKEMPFKPQLVASPTEALARAKAAQAKGAGGRQVELSAEAAAAEMAKNQAANELESARKDGQSKVQAVRRAIDHLKRATALYGESDEAVIKLQRITETLKGHVQASKRVFDRRKADLQAATERKEAAIEAVIAEERRLGQADARKLARKATRAGRSMAMLGRTGI
jgi:hypothetical protein